MLDEFRANLGDAPHGTQHASPRDRDAAPNAPIGAIDQRRGALNDADYAQLESEPQGGPRHIGESLRKVLTKLTGDDPERRTLVARVLGVAASQKGER